MDQAIAGLVTPLLEDIDGELSAGYSAVLYGSAARGEYLAGTSDLNLLLVCESLRPEMLRALSPALERLRRERQSPPLLIERREWERAADVFPIEVTDMQAAHETLRGADPVAGVAVDRGDLRRALEQELRGRLLRLRQAFALHAGDAAALGEIAARSVSSVAALLRAGLALHGKPVPRATPEALQAAGTALGVNPRFVVELWQGRAARAACPSDVFEAYLAAVASAVRVIDQFTPGGN